MVIVCMEKSSKCFEPVSGHDICNEGTPCSSIPVLRHCGLFYYAHEHMDSQELSHLFIGDFQLDTLLLHRIQIGLKNKAFDHVIVKHLLEIFNRGWNFQRRWRKREDFQVTSGDSKFCFLRRNSLEDEDWKGVAVPEVDGSLMTGATKGYGGGDALRLTMCT
ncbi:hypothetical protein QYM36_005827 [Artemia franciscana]|uniref:Uncharacterized protein n=1 Tax=Artemia franciscana TaxID=6661 RepID=A0AA88HWW9_ARTSF|nr:hypothetical protein QYM36_005827 [Artemia franciscana]